MAFNPLAMLAPMLGLTKEQIDGLRDPRFQQRLLRTWEGLQSIDPDQLGRIERKLDAVLARIGGDNADRSVVSGLLAGSCGEPDDGVATRLSHDRAA